MELTGFGPDRKLGDEVKLAKKLAHHLAGIVSLAELFKLSQDPVEGFLGLADGHIRIVLALAFQAGVVLQKFLAVEVRETLARRTPPRPKWT